MAGAAASAVVVPQPRHPSVLRPAGVQRGLVMDVLRRPQSAARPDQYRPAMAYRYLDRDRLPSGRPGCGVVPDTAGAVGRLCGRAQLRDLVAERLSDQARP